jgi:formate dehydrogenase subunit delta
MSSAPEVRMGNDIARHFSHMSPDEAAQAIAQHIESFWTPAMRLRLEALVAEGDDDLEPTLVDAAGRVAAHAR